MSPVCEAERFFSACAGVYLSVQNAIMQSTCEAERFFPRMRGGVPASAQNAIMQSTFTSCLRVVFRDLGK